MGRIFALICLMLLLGTASSRAELQLQPRMQATCWPASPASYTILRWKPRDTCTNDCFVSRLTCTNGKSYELASKVHPATTDFQMALSNWMPWSLLLYATQDEVDKLRKPRIKKALRNNAAAIDALMRTKVDMEALGEDTRGLDETLNILQNS